MQDKQFLHAYDFMLRQVHTVHFESKFNLICAVKEHKYQISSKYIRPDVICYMRTDI
jgi:hypothetical protein